MSKASDEAKRVAAIVDSLADRVYRSPDRKFGLRLPKKVIRHMLALSASRVPNETGGVLVGRYTKELDFAVVSEASAQPADSRAGRTWFKRGVRGLRRWLTQLWQRRTYYLGEWHFHPFAAPNPSRVDKQQLSEIASSSDYQCEAPLLIIVGGNPEGEWTLRAFVLPTGKVMVELPEVPHLPSTA